MAEKPTLTIIRNNGVIEFYDVYYPASIPFITRLTRQDAETIFGLYTYYGGNITARQVANEFPKYTLSEIKKIFKCFKLTKDSSFAPPHLIEELNEYFKYFYYIVMVSGYSRRRDCIMKSTLYVEYQEKQMDEKDLVAKAKKIWTDGGKKVSELTSLQLYVKPEENMAYCVFNDDVKGEFSLD